MVSFTLLRELYDLSESFTFSFLGEKQWIEAKKKWTRIFFFRIIIFLDFFDRLGSWRLSLPYHRESNLE